MIQLVIKLCHQYPRVSLFTDTNRDQALDIIRNNDG